MSASEKCRQGSTKKRRRTKAKHYDNYHKPNSHDRHLVYGYIREKYKTGNIPNVIIDLCIKLFCDNDDWDGVNMIECLAENHRIKDKTVFNYYCERYNLFGMDKIKRNEVKTWRVQIVTHDGSMPFIGIIPAHSNEYYFVKSTPGLYCIYAKEWNENDIMRLHLDMIEGKLIFYKDDLVIDEKLDVNVKQQYKLIIGLNYGITVKLLQ